MRERTSIFRGALLLTGTNIFLRGVSMCFQVWLSRRMGAAGLGLLQLVLTVGYFALTVGSAGIRTASMVLTARQFGKGSSSGVYQVVRRCLLYGFVLSAAAGTVLVAAAEPIAVRWLGDVRAVRALRLTGLFLPASCACAVLSGYVTACGKLKALIATEIAERFLGIGITVLLLLRAQGELGASCAAIVAGSSGAAVFTVAVLLTQFLREYRGCRRSSVRVGLLRLCVPLALNDVLRAGLSTVEQLMIPAGLALSANRERGLAVYGTVQAMVFPLLMFPAVLLYALSDLLVPELSRCRAAGDERRVTALTGRCFRLGLAYAAVCAGFFYCTAPALGELLYASREAGELLRLFAPTLLFLYADAIVDGLHKGLGQQVACVRYNTLTAFLDVVFLWLLLPRYGMSGYLMSFTVTHLLNFFLSVRRLLVVTAFIPSMTDTAVLLLTACVCSAVALLLPLPGGTWAVLLGRGGVFLLLALVAVKKLYYMEIDGIFPTRSERKLRKTSMRAVDKSRFVG